MALQAFEQETVGSKSVFVEWLFRFVIHVPDAFCMYNIGMRLCLPWHV